MVPCCCCCYWRADGRRLYKTELFCQNGCLTVFPNYCSPERWFGLNRISHPDWVKLCVELNYAPSQNTKISSATNIFQFSTLIIIITTIKRQRLEDNIEKHDGGLITATKNDTNNRMRIIRKQKWEEKQLYGRFKRLINNIPHEKTYMWLRKGNLKRETDSFNSSTKKRHINQLYQSENR